MRHSIPPLAFLLLVLQTSMPAHAACAATLAQLAELVSDPKFSLKWQESTMSDAQPLVVSVLEKEGALALEFVKTGQGLWAQGSGVICGHESELHIDFAAGQLRMGPAAHWVLRLALANGGKFTLKRRAGGQLHIATSGWSGDFAPAAQ